MTLDDILENAKNKMQDKDLKQSLELLDNDLEFNEKCNMNRMWYQGGKYNRKWLQFAEKDHKEVLKLTNEWTIRKSLEGINPFMCGREIDLNKSRLRSISHRIDSLVIGFKSDEEIKKDTQ